MHLKQLMLTLLVLVLGNSLLLATSPIGEKEPLIEVLEKIGEKYEVIFSYNSKDLKHISVRFELKEAESLEVAINRALVNTELKYKYLGANFFVVHKNNKAGKRKLKKIQRKINQIERLGDSNDLSISTTNSVDKIFYTADKLKATRTIRGQITDEDGEVLIGATVIVSGTHIGTSTDLEGNYQLSIPSSTPSLDVTYTGYSNEKVELDQQSIVNVQLVEGIALNSVTVFGSRGKPRTSFDSPIPVDHISLDVLNTSGQNSLDQQLMFKVPSYNSTQQPVSDASAHFNPADLRGLLPSRTLVLVNGKRKNSSALVYSVSTIGRGEVGVDMQSISSDAIERVEILRDGAAAQYGSDAVAGVINLVLKKQTDPFINIGYSATSAGDGTQFKAATGFSTALTPKGHASFTLSYTQQQRTQRAGTISSPEAEAAYWKTDTYSPADIYSLEYFQEFLTRNPSAGSQVGIPDTRAFNFAFNGAYILDKATNTELYAFGTLMERTGSSPQFARVPHWVAGFESIYPGKDFFLPEMSPRIADNTLVIGLKTDLLGWNIDISTTGGRNKIEYSIINSFNQSLGANSPQNFDNGAHSFSHVVNNLDVVKTFEPQAIKSLTFAIGIEQRTENFKTVAGEFASYADGSPDVLDRIGSESFSGFKPEDESSNYRNNLGFYTELTADVSTKLLVGGAVRLEHYSDFGNNVSWKLNSRYKAIQNRLNFRASMSNGFRAPALHQIYYTAITTTITKDGIVQNRFFNNLDPALHPLGIPMLKPETSFNLGGGFTYQANKKIGFAADIYHIKVADRIVLSGQVGKTEGGTSPIDHFLTNLDIGSAGFFLNAVTTTTKGIDLVLNFEDTRIGKGSLKGSVAANFNETTVEEINLPRFIEKNNLSNNVLSREDISRIESWRPKQKIIATSTYTLQRLSSTLSLFYYGAVTHQHSDIAAYDATYKGKMLTDVSFSFAANEHLKLRLGVNNLFNVYPDTYEIAFDGVAPDRNLDFVGRFKYPWQTTQFGIDGTRFFSRVNYIF